MAIKIAQLEEAAEQFVDTKYLYKDLRLDFSVEKRYDTAYNQTIIKNDIGVDYDIFAIRNSIAIFVSSLRFRFTGIFVRANYGGSFRGNKKYYNNDNY
jgi:hypothetical protein